MGWADFAISPFTGMASHASKRRLDLSLRPVFLNLVFDGLPSLV